MKTKIYKIAICLCFLFIGWNLSSVFYTIKYRDYVRHEMEDIGEIIIKDVHKKLGENWHVDTFLYNFNNHLGISGSNGIKLIIDPNFNTFVLTSGDTIFAGYYNDYDENWFGLWNLRESENWELLNIKP